MNIHAQHHIRWMIHCDLAAVLTIERATTPDPWTEQTFLALLRERNIIGIVAENRDWCGHNSVNGFMIYGLEHKRFRLIHLAVSPGCQRRGVGRQLVRRMADRLAPGVRERIVADVCERNLGMQLFLRSVGFKATKVLRRLFGDEDGYRMEYLFPAN